MERFIEFDISIDGTSPEVFANWLENSPKLQLPTENKNHLIYLSMETHPPNEDQRYYLVVVFVEAYITEGGKQKITGQSQEDFTKPLVDYLIEHPDFDTNTLDADKLVIGLITVIPIGVNRIEAICETFYKNPEEMIPLEDWIFTVYGKQIHNNMQDHINNNRSTKTEIIEKHPAGRPHLPDDIWAYNEIYIHKRDPLVVEKEWIERPGVKARDLIDPKRHFKRIKSPNWLKNNHPTTKSDNNDDII